VIGHTARPTLSNAPQAVPDVQGVGLFVAVNGFSGLALKAYAEATPFLTIDGSDLFLVLDGRGSPCVAACGPGSTAPSRSRGTSIATGPIWVINVVARVPFRELRGYGADRVVLVLAEVVAHCVGHSWSYPPTIAGLSDQLPRYSDSPVFGVRRASGAAFGSICASCWVR